MNQPISSGELAGGPHDPANPAELADAVRTARIIEGTTGLDDIHPSPEFGDRVMAALAGEPTPRRTWRGSLAVALGSAWHTLQRADRPVLVRARAAGILLAVAILAVSLGGAASLAAAGAIRLLEGPPSTGPVISPAPAPSSSVPSPSPSATASPQLSISPGPSPTAQPPTAPVVTPTPTASDDHGGGGGSGGGGGGSGGGGDNSGKPTPTPGRIPRPTETPEASDH